VIAVVVIGVIVAAVIVAVTGCTTVAQRLLKPSLCVTCLYCAFGKLCAVMVTAV
jgi:hypothetical protein